MQAPVYLILCRYFILRVVINTTVFNFAALPNLSLTPEAKNLFPEEQSYFRKTFTCTPEKDIRLFYRADCFYLTRYPTKDRIKKSRALIALVV